MKLLFSRFLEEVDHKLEANLRNPLRRHTLQHRQEKPKLPYYLFRLKNKAWERGTTLRFLPRHFASSRDNSTRFIVKESLIRYCYRIIISMVICNNVHNSYFVAHKLFQFGGFCFSNLQMYFPVSSRILFSFHRWKVQLIFHQADVQLTAHSVSENVTVNKLLAPYLDPNSDLPDDIKEKLGYYHSASFGGVSALMKTDVQGEGMVFQELFPHKSLRSNFANKTIIEHPILYVVLKHHVDAYLEYQSLGHDDLFQFSDMAKEITKYDGLNYFDADSDQDIDGDSDNDMEEGEWLC